MRSLGAVGCLLVVACGSSAAPATPPPSSQIARGAGVPIIATRSSAEPAQTELDAGAETGFDHTVLTVVRGARSYSLIETDVERAGLAAAHGEPSPDAFDTAIGDLVGACLHGDREVECVSEISPNLGYFASNVAERGHAWSVVAREGEHVVASRSLVALSAHDLADATTERPTLAVSDLDGDGHDEVDVVVPVVPLRDDMMQVSRYDESGSVHYILDETLATEVRLTSSWLLVGPDDGESDEGPSMASCGTDATIAPDGTLTLLDTCVADHERETTCERDAASGQYRCPRELEGPLLGPAEAPWRHYVGETETELLRQLPRLGARMGEVRALALSSAAEEADQPTTDVQPSGEAPSTASTTTRGPGETGCIVDDPAPPLHVRASASSHAEIVGDLPNGTVVSFVERSGHWARIAAPTQGWIWTDDVRCP